LSYPSRSKHSNYGKQRRFSNPSFSGSRPKPLPIKEVKSQRDSIWKELNEKEKKVSLGQMSREDYENYRDYTFKEGFPEKIDLSPMVYKTTIGHYGGLYITVPEEQFDAFKALFPSSEFPREVETIDVRELDAVSEGYYRQLFPNSNRYKTVYFRNGSAGEKRIELTMDLPRDRETNPGD